MRKLDRLAGILVQSGLENVVRAMRPALAPHLPVLAYHRVVPRDYPIASFPYDSHTLSADIDAFHDQMRFIKAHYSPVSLKQLIAYLDDDADLPSRPVLVTFDDGYSDNHSVAAPVLAELGIPATFFVAAGYIGERKTFWFDWLALTINEVTVRSLEIDGLGMEVPIATNDEKGAAYSMLVTKLKAVDDAVRLGVLAEIKERYGDCYEMVSAEIRELSRPFSWDDAREMVAAGMEIASHSMTHPILSKLADDALVYEIHESKRKIEEETGQEVVAIAYPNGSPADYDERTRREVSRANYRLGFSYMRGTNSLRNLELLDFQRLPVIMSTTMARFAAQLALPEGFSR